MVAAIAKPPLPLSRVPVRQALVVLSCLAVCLPPGVVQAAAPQRETARASTAQLPPTVVVDIALAPGGTLRGMVCNTQNAAQADVEVALRSGGQHVGRVVAGRMGKFEVTGLRGGLYQLVTLRHSRLVRLWTPGTAPPSAQQIAVLIVPHTAVRGQSPRPYRFSSDALLLGTIVTAGAAVPWIISGSRSNDSSGS